MTELLTKNLFKNPEASVVFEEILAYEYPWEALPHIKEIVEGLISRLNPEDYYSPTEGVYIAKGVELPPTATVLPPTVIMSGAEIRPSAYIRGSVIVGRGAVVGNSTEIKNSILFDGAQAPHFNYIGDSILGYKSHMGAGAVTSNLKSDKTSVTVKLGEEKIETGLRKFGAILGDLVEVGCGAVLNPGTVIGRLTSVYPLSSVRGFVPEDSILKSGGIVVKRR